MLRLVLWRPASNSMKRFRNQWNRIERWLPNQFSFPVLAIGGERGSTPSIGQDILRIVPHARGLVFPCGHYVPEEQSERLVDELRRFFKGRHG